MRKLSQSIQQQELHLCDPENGTHRLGELLKVTVDRRCLYLIKLRFMMMENQKQFEMHPSLLL